MINKEKVRQLIDAEIEGSDIVVIDVQISNTNQIKVILDSFNGVTIDKCVKISRLVEGSLNREEEDFELEVSSYGLGQPFMLPLHFFKNVNRKIEVFFKDGRSLKGILKAVELSEDKERINQIEISNKKRVKPEGKKKKIEVEEITKVTGGEIQKAKLVPIF